MVNLVKIVLIILFVMQIGACSSARPSVEGHKASEQGAVSQGLIIHVDVIVPEITTLSIDGCRVDATAGEVEELRAYHDKTNFVWRSVACMVRIENKSSDAWILSRQDIKALVRRAVVMQDDSGQTWKIARTLLPHGSDPCYDVPSMRNSLKTVILHLLNSHMIPAGDVQTEIEYPEYIKFRVSQPVGIRGRRICGSGVADKPEVVRVSGSGVTKVSPHGLDLIAK